MGLQTVPDHPYITLDLCGWFNTPCICHAYIDLSGNVTTLQIGSYSGPRGNEIEDRPVSYIVLNNDF